MGIEYSAKIVVGLPVEEMKDLQDDEGYWDEGGILEFVPDSYDSQSGVVGIVVKHSGDYNYSQISVGDLFVNIEDALNDFYQITKREAKVYLSTCGH
jgi:hypothetical protein